MLISLRAWRFSGDEVSRHKCVEERYHAIVERHVDLRADARLRSLEQGGEDRAAAHQGRVVDGKRRTGFMRQFAWMARRRDDTAHRLRDQIAAEFAGKRALPSVGGEMADD